MTAEKEMQRRLTQGEQELLQEMAQLIVLMRVNSYNRI